MLIICKLLYSILALVTTQNQQFVDQIVKLSPETLGLFLITVICELRRKEKGPNL